MFKKLLCAGIACLTSLTAFAHEPGEARYIANEAVMVTHGETKILFDPLPITGFGTYPDVPEADKKAMMAGEAPYDGVDAVFISHAHRDHFSAEDMNKYMSTHSEIRLIAPQQAVDMMREAPGWENNFNQRIAGLNIEFGAAPVEVHMDGLDSTGVRIPHAGWPGRANVENIVYRVTLDDQITVSHMGDADINPDHYRPFEKLWDQKPIDLAMPPYWIYMDPDGPEVLEMMNVRDSVGIHVPIQVPVPLITSGADYFSESGDTRTIPVAQNPCTPVTFDEAKFTVCTVNKDADIRLFLKDENGEPFGHFSNLAKQLEKQGETLTLAMNGGMYHDDRRPVGYYIENGIKAQELMTRKSNGNFGLLPNGVFYVAEDGSVAVQETLAFKNAQPKTRYATQSGPMLVINGKLHPAFRASSDSRKRRNGVGVSDDKIYFVISEEPVNFHHFARLFKDELETPNALFLDGVISRLYDPANERNDGGLKMGPIVGVVIETSKNAQSVTNLTE